MRFAAVPVSAVLACLAGAAPLRAESTTYVTTYVTKVQEERASTRWTLTEWLRIKERMRMMDVWLAMFSNPKTDSFSPELNLAYGFSRGAVTLKNAGEGEPEVAQVNGAQGRAQLWLTNLISTAVGIRTLNIDLGGEVAQRGEGGGDDADSAPRSAASVGVVAGAFVPATTTYYTGNLRLFGKNIQDSSLVFKYGEYTSENRIPAWSAIQDPRARRGKVAGAELQVYVLPWLGAEGNYLAFGDAKSFKGSDEVRGTYVDYVGFVEVSLVRLTVGRYQEDWTVASGDGVQSTAERGLLFGSKLSF